MNFEGVQRCVGVLLEAESSWREGGLSVAEFGERCGEVDQAVVEGLARTQTQPESQTRALFRVELHPDSHALALVSEATAISDGTGKYELRVVVDATAAEPRVVRVDYICTACVGLGVGPRGEACLECGGDGWDPWFGEAAAMGLRFGTPLALRVLAAPRSSLYLPEHNRRMALARREGLLIEGDSSHREKA